MSVTFLGVVIAAVAVGLAAHYHSGGALRIALALALLVPYGSSAIVFGATDLPQVAELHPATWIVAVAGLRAAVSDPARARALLARYRYATGAALLLTAAAVFWTLRARGHVPGPILVNQVMVPFGLLIWTRSRIEEAPSEAVALPRFVVLLGCAEALLALAGVALHFESLWGITTDYGRQAATLNGPLPLALLLVTCVPLSISIRSSVGRMAVLVLLLAGILTTQSRSGLIIGIVCAAYVVFAGRASIGARVMVVLLAPVVVIGVLQSTVVAGVASRFADDLGSASLRSTAADYFWDHLDTWLVTGQGFGSSYTVARSAGLQSSFESAFYMYSVDVGFLVTVVAFGLLLAQLLLPRPWRRPVLNGGVVAAVGCFVQVQGYSSIATESAAGVVLWIAFAFGAATTSRQPRSSTETELSDEAVPRSAAGALSAAR